VILEGRELLEAGTAHVEGGDLVQPVGGSRHPSVAPASVTLVRGASGLGRGCGAGAGSGDLSFVVAMQQIADAIDDRAQRIVGRASGTGALPPGIASTFRRGRAWVM
jgi:hypothetical protein